MGLNTDAHHRELIFSNLLLILIYIACIYFKLPFSATARWDENECGMLKQTTVRCFFGGTPPCAYKRIFVSVKLPGPTLVDFVRSCCYYAYCTPVVPQWLDLSVNFPSYCYHRLQMQIMRSVTTFSPVLSFFIATAVCCILTVVSKIKIHVTSWSERTIRKSSYSPCALTE